MVMFMLNRELFRHLFSVTVMLYAWLYDDFRHEYISRIYQHDKYGVVVMYSTIVCLLFVVYQQTGNTEVCKRISRALAGPTHQLALQAESHAAVWNQDAYILALLSGLKILAFNLIFKNNTSEEHAHQKVHICFVVVLGVVSILYHVKLSFLRTDPMYLWKKLRNLVLFGVLFQLTGWWAPKTWYCNAFTAAMEALLIEQTM